MALSAEEARVLASLIEKATTVPDSYPLSVNALRLACNQTTARAPIVSYDDRTVEAALLSLKSIGLVRFVHPSHGGRTTRYRHVADERWHLSAGELAVLSVLVLRGPQTAGEIRTRIERQHRFDDPHGVDDALDTLAARSPEPLAVRLERRPGERDVRWADLLTGEPPPAPEPTQAVTSPARRDRIDELAADVAELRARLERLEKALGVEA
jgi:uncharacterized protein YceH (UPF0502 family)